MAVNRYRLMNYEFKQFYEENKDKLFGYLLRRCGDYAVSSDALQESFTRYLERYGTEKNSVSLLFTIGRNVLNDFFRLRKREISYNSEQDTRKDHTDAESRSLIKEEYQNLLKALQQLDTDDRDLLSLASGGSLSYRQIAELLNTTEANVKIRVHRARITLKKIRGDL